MKSPPITVQHKRTEKEERKLREENKKSPRAREREREREKIHPLSHIHMHGFASTLTAPRFRTSFFHPESAFLHPCTPVLIHTVACLFLSSWVLCLRAESSVCLSVGRGRRKNAWLWRCAFRLSALFAYAALSNLLSLSSDPCCRLL